MYRVFMKLISGGDIHTMVSISADGAGMSAMSVRGHKCAGILDVEVQADVGAIT